MALFEFKTLVLTNIQDYPCLEFDSNLYYHASSCSVLPSKSDSRLVTHLQTYDLDNPGFYESFVMSYELKSGKNGAWKTHQKLTVKSTISE